MNERRDLLISNMPVHRRDLLRAVTAGLALAGIGAALLDYSRAAPAFSNDKRKARYRANSPEVQSFYRVNRYPGQ